MKSDNRMYLHRHRVVTYLENSLLESMCNKDMKDLVAAKGTSEERK